MTKEVFEDGLKILKRFLKDQGLYTAIFKNYLFKDGRKQEDLFNEFNSSIFPNVDDWRVLFDKINLLVGSNGHFSYIEFVNLIEENNIVVKWKKYYNKHTKTLIK